MDDDDREERFVRLHRDLQPKIAAYVRRRLPEPDAADALAETFLTAWRRLDGVPDDPLPWRYQIAANSVANQRRSVRRWLRLQHRPLAWRELDSVRDSALPTSVYSSAMPDAVRGAGVGWRGSRIPAEPGPRSINTVLKSANLRGRRRSRTSALIPYAG